ncbi:MAG: hypothetical protein R3C16_02590 [Hyphomonadaceae bacterium]
MRPVSSADVGVLFAHGGEHFLHARIVQHRVDAGERLRRLRRHAEHALERLERVLRGRVVAQLHAVVLIDAGERAGAADGDLEAAEMIDQAAFQSLLTGPDPAMRHGMGLFLRHVTAIGDERDKSA